MNKYEIYTDGSSRGNPGPGGFGAIIIHHGKSETPSPKSEIKEIGGRDENTTNNKMEMRAAIESLRIIPENSKVEIHSDSEYLIKGITEWIKGWQKNGWRTKDKKEVLNKELWLDLLAETQKREVEWKKVLGHSGHALNDRCDLIATSFADLYPIDLYSGPKENYPVS